MRVTLKINDKTYNYTSSVSKRKIGEAISRLQRENGRLSGECTVQYAKQYKTEFSFSDENDLRNKLMPCLEKELVDDFTGKE